MDEESRVKIYSEMVKKYKEYFISIGEEPYNVMRRIYDASMIEFCIEIGEYNPGLKKCKEYSLVDLVNNKLDGESKGFISVILVEFL